MSYLDEMMKQAQKVNGKKKYVKVERVEKPPISEDRARIRTLLKEENISDKELVEILLKEQKRRAEEEEAKRQAELKRKAEEEAYAKRLAEEEARLVERVARQQVLIKQLEEEEAKNQEAITRLEEEKRLKTESVIVENRTTSACKPLEEARLRVAEKRRLAEIESQEIMVEEVKESEELVEELVEEELPMVILEGSEVKASCWDKNQVNQLKEKTPQEKPRRRKTRVKKANKQNNEIAKADEIDVANVDEVDVVNDTENTLELNKDDKKSKKKSIGRELLEWLIYIAVIVGIMFLIITYVGVRTKVSGSSMESTLHNNDNLIVEKLSYRFNDPERYDIVVFPYEYEDGVYYIKRIIGMPGETVQVVGGAVYINGEVLESDVYGEEPMESAGIAESEITLGADEYFVLGDNRNHSSDSRDQSVGVLKGSDFIGKAWVRIWPISQFGVLNHE